MCRKFEVLIFVRNGNLGTKLALISTIFLMSNLISMCINCTLQISFSSNRQKKIVRYFDKFKWKLTDGATPNRLLSTRRMVAHQTTVKGDYIRTFSLLWYENDRTCFIFSMILIKKKCGQILYCIIIPFKKNCIMFWLFVQPFRNHDFK